LQAKLSEKHGFANFTAKLEAYKKAAVASKVAVNAAKQFSLEAYKRSIAPAPTSTHYYPPRHITNQ
jgi:hypothetical protein